MNTKTGGAAFGTVISLDCVRADMNGSMDYEPTIQPGNLTVRDYFAARAMQGMVSDGAIATNCGQARVNGLAIMAYEIADAMLIARSEAS